MKRYTLLHLQQWNLKLKEKVTPAISHVSQITWLDTGLEFWRRDTTKTTTDPPHPPHPIPPTKTKPRLNTLGFVIINFDYIICYAICEGTKKKLQTPRILLRCNTIGDSEKHVSLRSLSFKRISQYFINCIYSFFSQSCRALFLSWLIRVSCVILFISGSPYSHCKRGWF